MKKASVLALKGAQGASGCSDRKGTFEVFGLDFMVDNKFNAWLIEANPIRVRVRVRVRVRLIEAKKTNP